MTVSHQSLLKATAIRSSTEGTLPSVQVKTIVLAHRSSLTNKHMQWKGFLEISKMDSNLFSSFDKDRGPEEAWKTETNIHEQGNFKKTQWYPAIWKLFSSEECYCDQKETWVPCKDGLTGKKVKILILSVNHHAQSKSTSCRCKYVDLWILCEMRSTMSKGLHMK